MKKYCILFILFVLTACHSNKEFKNPIFNQELEPLGKTVGYTYLTPTSIDFRNILDKNKIDSQGECDLIENKEDRITLKCMFDEWGGKKEKYTLYLTYIIGEKFSDNCLRIIEYSYNNPDSRFKSHATYCTTPPSKQTLESD